MGSFTLTGYILGQSSDYSCELFFGLVDGNRVTLTRGATFILLGLVLLSLSLTGSTAHRVVDKLKVTVMFVALLDGVSYFYGVGTFGKRGLYTPMPLTSALSFIVISIGILLAQARPSLVDSLTQQNPAGLLLRRLLPPMIIVPILLGLASNYGESER